MPTMHEQQHTFSTAEELLLKQPKFSGLDNSSLLLELEPTTFRLYFGSCMDELSQVNCGMQLLINSKTSTSTLLRFGNGHVISPHALKLMYLFIHVGIEV